MLDMHNVAVLHRDIFPVFTMFTTAVGACACIAETGSLDSTRAKYASCSLKETLLPIPRSSPFVSHTVAASEAPGYKVINFKALELYRPLEFNRYTKKILCRVPEEECLFRQHAKLLRKVLATSPLLQVKVIDKLRIVGVLRRAMVYCRR